MKIGFARIAMVAVFIGAFVALGALVSAEEQAAPDVIVIKPGIYEQLTKAPVEFTHKKHAEDYGIACADCHHVYENGQNVWKEGDPVQKCEECHTDATVKGEKKLPPEQQKLNLKLAFHNNCINCHRDLKKENPETKAPTTCKGCHPKPEGAAKQ
ncbi:cytochrome c3 family protein [Thermodesulforhabdus norvegica]|uniref:Class III cytochrome C family protein n=1 Tax=Thermodesulforhabdus norvegica TaxID=39841 RepID=A0A1I4VGM1_9BACT|nr:cytochrome c3 family protein [Thermodesulforhabdus norvegica]SFN00243.1 Class III cytochrome C family protein [Thermodesulforhabdus norvegica]